MAAIDLTPVRLVVTHENFEMKRQDIFEKLCREIAPEFGVDYDATSSGTLLLIEETVRHLIENYRDPKGRVFPGSRFWGNAFIPEYERNEIEYAKFLRDPDAYNAAHGETHYFAANPYLIKELL